MQNMRKHDNPLPEEAPYQIFFLKMGAVVSEKRLEKLLTMLMMKMTPTHVNRPVS